LLQDGQPLACRYTLQPKAKINVLTLRALPTGSDTASVSPTMLGAIFGGSFGKLPKQMAKLVWEARSQGDLNFHLTFKFRSGNLQSNLVSSSPPSGYYLNYVADSFFQVRVDPSPALIRPLKPKLWLTGKLEVPAHTAVLIT
jgi:hypothetical protein